MKLLQLNIWAGRLLNPILKLVEEEQPDILCLQEVYSSSDTMLKVNGGMYSSLELIKQKAGHDHSFLSPTFSLNLSNHKLYFGNAVISRFPLANTKEVFVCSEYAAEIDLTQREPNIRNLQIVTAQIDGESLVIANHHGYWDRDPLGNQTSIDCMQKVADALKPVQGPLVLAGDLNLKPPSPAMRVFDGFLEDLTATYNVKSTLSLVSPYGDVACDHILVSPQIKVNGFRVAEAIVSDHKALILDFDL